MNTRDREQNLYQPKIIVSGATGFIGRHIVKKLIDNKYDVYALSRDLEKASSLECLKNANHLYFDITKPYLISNLPTNAIFIHCAWEDVQDMLSIKHLAIHFMSHYSLIKSLIEHGISKILITGTLSEYGLQYGPVKASNFTQPNTPYSIAKDLLHRSLRALQLKIEFNLIWARLFYMYGEGQNEKCIVPLFDNALERGDPLFNMSFGEQLLDYSPVEEVADKIINLLPYKNGTFNVCSGEPISLRRLLEERAIKKGKKIKLNLGYYQYRKSDSLSIWGDPTESKLTSEEVHSDE